MDHRLPQCTSGLSVPAVPVCVLCACVLHLCMAVLLFMHGIDFTGSGSASAGVKQDLENVVGDVVVAASAIAYSGPFTPAFRQLLQQEWTTLLKTASVPHTPGANLIDTLQVALFLLLSLGLTICVKLVL